MTEVAEVLTVTAKKLAERKLGRKFTGQPKKDPAALKKETHCTVCGECEHWKGDPECPMSGQSGSAGAKPSPSSPPAPTSRSSASSSLRPSVGGAPKAEAKARRGPHQTFFVRDCSSVEATEADDRPDFRLPGHRRAHAPVPATTAGS